MTLRLVDQVFTPPCSEREMIERLLRRPGAAFLDGGDGAGALLSLRFGPSLTLTCRGHLASLRAMKEGRAAMETLQGPPLELFEGILRRYPTAVVEAAGAQPMGMLVQAEQPTDHEKNGWAAALPGWVVFASYDLGRMILPRLEPPSADGPDFPDLYAAFYPWALTRRTDGWHLQTLIGVPGGPFAAQEVEVMLGEVLAGASHRARGPRLAPPRTLWSRDDYARAFNAVKEAIEAGDVYLANLTQRFIAPGRVDPVALYMSLRENSPAPYACFLDCGDGRFLLSSSPERFLRAYGRNIETRPIKGTRRVSGDAALDARLREELLADAKERAELSMVVDLERNDLGRICEPGGVHVSELFGVESFRDVHHLVATVRGVLRADIRFADILRAAFPGGSVTGTPKLRAMQLLREIEPWARGPYTGSVFTLGLDGSFDGNILIRTLLVEPEGVSFNTGGGIVADSTLEAEYAECFTKTAGMVRALKPFCAGE